MDPIDNTVANSLPEQMDISEDYAPLVPGTILIYNML